MFYETKKYFGRSGITIGCPDCGGRSKKFGWFRGRRRYCCLSCSKTFGRQKHLPVGFSDFSRFYCLVTGKVNRRRLMDERKISRPTLSLAFRPFFNKPLLPEEVWQVLPPKLNVPWVYGVDGKWLKRLGVFVLHRNVTTGENLSWSFHPGETYDALTLDMAKLLELLDQKIAGSHRRPQAAVSDWKGAIVNAVTLGFGEIPHQRCLTHVDRMAKNLLSKNSPFLATLKLRSLAEKLIRINSRKEVAVWVSQLDRGGMPATASCSRRGVKIHRPKEAGGIPTVTCAAAGGC